MVFLSLKLIGVLVISITVVSVGAVIFCCGPVFVLWIYHVMQVCVCDEKSIRRILHHSSLTSKADVFYKRVQYVFGQRFQGNGIAIVKEHSLWEKKHKLMSPPFATQTLQQRRRFLHQLPAQCSEAKQVHCHAGIHK